MSGAAFLVNNLVNEDGNKQKTEGAKIAVEAIIQILPLVCCHISQSQHCLRPPLVGLSI